MEFSVAKSAFGHRADRQISRKLEKAKPDKGYGVLSGEIRLRPVAWDRPTEVRVEAGTELAAFLGGLFAGGATLSDGGSNDNGNGERIKETSGSTGIGGR